MLRVQACTCFNSDIVSDHHGAPNWKQDQGSFYPWQPDRPAGMGRSFQEV